MLCILAHTLDFADHENAMLPASRCAGQSGSKSLRLWAMEISVPHPNDQASDLHGLNVSQVLSHYDGPVLIYLTQESSVTAKCGGSQNRVLRRESSYYRGR